MDKLPLTSLSTLIALAVFFWTVFLVGRARTKYNVPAPATGGNEMFDRCFRVQMNTLEQLILMLPALWLCAFWVGDLVAAICALVWSVGRIIYGVTYLSDPKKRGTGFLLTIAPSFLLSILTVLQIARSLT